MSLSAMEARRRRGQYSQIWESQRILRVLAAFASSSETSRLKVGLWAGTSSSSFSTAGEGSSRVWARWSSSHIRRRIVPIRSIAEPKFGGKREAISRRIRVANLQPLPEVVMPICRGPSEWVDGRLKVQRFGESRTLTGIRCLLHMVEMCVRVSTISD